MKRILLLLIPVIHGAGIVRADEKDRDLRIDAANSVVVGGGSFLKQALGRADLALASSRIQPKHLQGAFGENLTGGYLDRGANWQQVRNSVGRTGIDHLQLKVGEGGRIEGLTVSEVKTGGARLGSTKDGRQMGSPWKAKRLKALGSRYKGLQESLRNGEIQRLRPQSVAQMRQIQEVPLDAREKVRFWREDSLKPWKLDATAEQANRVPKQLGRLSQYLDAAGDGRIGYRSRIFNVSVEGDSLLLRVKDAAGVERGLPESKLPILDTRRYPIKGGGSIGQSLTKAFQGELKRLHPELSDREITTRARELASDSLRRNLDFRPKGMVAAMGTRASVAGGIGVLVASSIELGLGIAGDEGIDHERIGANALAGGLGFALGELSGATTTHLLLNTTVGSSVTSQVASSMGLASSSYTANLMGSALGGGAAAAVFSYVLYFAGYSDLQTANRLAVAGAVGSLAGAGTSALITSLVAAYGTAGTGVAISSLSGAAATSATLAAVGGGSMAIGSALVATGVGVVVVAAGAGVIWAFTLYDAAEENERLELTYHYLTTHFVGQLR